MAMYTILGCVQDMTCCHSSEQQNFELRLAMRDVNRKPLTGGGAQLLFVIIRTDAKFTQLGFNRIYSGHRSIWVSLRADPLRLDCAGTPCEAFL